MTIKPWRLHGNYLDVVTIIEELEECYPLLQEQKYLDRESKWSAAVKKSRELAERQPDYMERVRQHVLFVWEQGKSEHRTHTPRSKSKALEALPDVRCEEKKSDII